MTTAEAPPADPGHATTAPDSLTWLRAALWAPGAEVDLVPVERADPRATWLARPASGPPELLVPLRSPRAAGATSRRFWDGMPARRRARQWLGEAALRSGIAQRGWPGRVALVGSDLDLDDPDRSLIARLARLLGQPRLLVAVTARPGQYNAKPVLALFTPAGDTVAFAKVAVDDVSAGYVATEIAWLRRAATAAAPLRAPRLLAEADWQGRPVALIEPLDLPRLPRRVPGWAREAVADAVVGLGPTARLPLGDSGPARRAREDAGDPLVDEALVLAVEGPDAGPVDCAPWHGDLSPWNTASRAREVLVWDWELAGEDMPVGSDLRHERVMVATHLRGHTAAAALAPLDPDDPAVAAYLLELVVRSRRAARSGRTDDEHHLGAAALGHLRRRAAR